MSAMMIMGSDETATNIAVGVFMLFIGIALITGGSIYFRDHKDEPYTSEQIIALLSISLGIIIIVGIAIFYYFR